MTRSGLKWLVQILSEKVSSECSPEIVKKSFGILDCSAGPDIEKNSS